MSSDRDAVVSMPAETNTLHVAGSDRQPCVECDTDVWVSPATQRSIEMGVYPDRIICIDCATEVADAERD